MATLLSDTFDRANSTTTVGSPQVGPAPVTQVGVAGISGNAFYAPTAPTLVTWSLGTAEVEISATVKNIDTGTKQAFLVLGYTSTTDFYMLGPYSLNSPMALYKSNPGGFAIVAVGGPVPSGIATDTYDYKLGYKAGLIRAYVNGVEVIRYTPPIPVTGTLHGLRSVSNLPTFDNLLAVDAPANPSDTVGKMSTAVPDTTKASPTTARTGFVYRGRDTKTADTTGVA